jgi:hypothetical protein
MSSVSGCGRITERKSLRPMGPVFILLVAFETQACRTDKCMFQVYFWCLCGLVVTVPGYRSRGSDSIPGPTRFSEK